MRGGHHNDGKLLPGRARMGVKSSGRVVTFMRNLLLLLLVIILVSIAMVMGILLLVVP
jgi:hypothetical protein